MLHRLNGNGEAAHHEWPVRHTNTDTHKKKQTDLFLFQCRLLLTVSRCLTVIVLRNYWWDFQRSLESSPRHFDFNSISCRITILFFFFLLFFLRHRSSEKLGANFDALWQGNVKMKIDSHCLTADKKHLKLTRGLFFFIIFSSVIHCRSRFTLSSFLPSDDKCCALLLLIFQLIWSRACERADAQMDFSFLRVKLKYRIHLSNFRRHTEVFWQLEIDMLTNNDSLAEDKEQANWQE